MICRSHLNISRVSRKAQNSLLVAGLGFGLALSGCGGSPVRQLQSITISPQSATAQTGQAPQFAATGQFNTAPMTVTPLAVDWAEWGPGIDIPGPEHSYALNAQPLTPLCPQHGTYVIVAIAPADPGAPASGPMPSQVFNDLVLNHTMSSESGFVAATAQLVCP